MQVTEVDRDIALALLKRLRQRELISEETYVAACNSRFFDRSAFEHYAENTTESISEEVVRHDEH